MNSKTTGRRTKLQKARINHPNVPVANIIAPFFRDRIGVKLAGPWPLRCFRPVLHDEQNSVLQVIHYRVRPQMRIPIEVRG
jgi:hypothetical protein